MLLLYLHLLYTVILLFRQDNNEKNYFNDHCMHNGASDGTAGTGPGLGSGSQDYQTGRHCIEIAENVRIYKFTVPV
jgi:hypothetical protein